MNLESFDKIKLFVRLYKNGRVLFQNRLYPDTINIRNKNIKSLLDSNFDNFPIRNEELSWREEDASRISILTTQGHLIFLKGILKNTWVQCNGMNNISDIAENLEIIDLDVVRKAIQILLNKGVLEKVKGKCDFYGNK
jgi:hypothetical protein